MVNKRNLIALITGLIIQLMSSSCRDENSAQSLVYVRLDSLITDSIPFLQQIRNSSAVRSKELNANKVNIDSPVLFKMTITDPLPNENHVDASDLSEPNYIYYIIGRKNGKEMIIFDTDNNRNFENEKAFEVFENAPFTTIYPVSFTLGDTTLTRSICVRPVIPTLKIDAPRKNSYNNTGIELAALPIFRTGSFVAADGVRFNLAVFNQFYDEYTNQNLSLVIGTANNRFPAAKSFPVQYRIGDTLFLNKLAYQIHSINRTGSLLTLKYLFKMNKPFGIDSGTYAIPTKFSDIMDGGHHNIPGSDKYQLLDFWGTWCEPCLKLTPELKEISRDYRDKDFELVGVAFDESVDRVRSYIRKNDIQWTNTFDEINNSVICKKFMIEDFPTFILIDKQGKILARGVGKDGLDKIKTALQLIK